MPKMCEGCPLFPIGLDITPEQINACVHVVKGNMTFNSGAAQTIATVPAGALVLDVICQVTTAFDGTGATVKIGDAADDDRFLASADISPANKGFSRSSAKTNAGSKGHIYTAATAVKAAIGAGDPANTAGAATAYIVYAISQ